MKNYYQLILVSFACICSSAHSTVECSSLFIISSQRALLFHLRGATFMRFGAQLLIGFQLLKIRACLHAQQII